MFNDKSQNKGIQFLLKILKLTMIGEIKWISAIGLQLLESYLFRKFKKQIANTLTKEIRFF